MRVSVTFSYLVFGCVVATAVGRADIEFPAIRHAAKMVLGSGGSDYGSPLGERQNRYVESMKELGLTLTRIGIGWGGVEPKPGVYDFEEEDRLVDFLLEQGIEVLGVVACAPEWALDGHPGDREFFERKGMGNLYSVVWPADVHIAAYEKACEKIGRHFRGRVRYYEMWNEPDGLAGPVILRGPEGEAREVRFGGDPVRYTEWLKATYRGLKRGDPDCLLAAGSLSVSGTAFTQAMYACGGKGFFDAISLHPYAEGTINSDWCREVRGVCVRKGDLRVEEWLTEYGWTTTGETDEFARAFHTDEETWTFLVADAIQEIARYPYITQAYLHTLNDWRDEDQDAATTQGFGIVDYNGGKKKTFGAYFSSLEAERRRQKSAERIGMPSVIFTGHSTEIRIDPPIAKGESLVFDGLAVASVPVGASTVRVEVSPSQEMTRSVPVAIMDGETLLLSLKYVEAVQPVVLDKPAGSRSEALGEFAILNFMMRNLSPFPQQTRVTCSPPEGWSVSPEHLDIKMVGDSERGSALMLQVPSEAEAGRYPVELMAVVLDATGANSMLGAHVSVPARIPYAQFEIFADGDLGDWPYFDPVLEIRDASAAVWSAWTQDHLRIAVSVKDGTHVTGEAAESLWRHDSIQIAFDALHDTPPGATYDRNDQEFAFGSISEQSVLWRHAAADGYSVGRALLADAAIRRTTRETVYEVALPWREISALPPRSGLMLGVEVVINDDDGEGRKAYEWCGGVAQAKEPARFGTWVLEPQD